MKKIIITGSGGLVGSESVRYFHDLYDEVIGIDNDYRGFLFGEKGSVENNIKDIKKLDKYHHYNIDIRDYEKILYLVSQEKPDAIIHCAGQPSHEKSSEIPYEDFQVNTTGTLNLLESARKVVPRCSFIFMSTNKVYGDKPNYVSRLVEHETRFNSPEIDETMSVDQCLHSPYGSNKLAADLLVQEYGRYYGLNTVCFRCGCITGKTHKGVEQHGFLSHLCKVAKTNEEYTIYGYNGKQVRDNIHASDLVSAFHNYLLRPTPAAVYNIGGGKENSCSILEAIENIEQKLGIKMKIRYDKNARKGDHICYMTNYKKFQRDYPEWKIKLSLEMIIQELIN